MKKLFSLLLLLLAINVQAVNVITQNSSGMAIYEDFSTNTVGAAYSGGFDNRGGTYTYRNMTRTGSDSSNVVLEVTSSGGSDYLNYTGYTSCSWTATIKTGVILDCWIRFNSNAGAKYVGPHLARPSGDSSDDDYASMYYNAGTGFTYLTEYRFAASQYLVNVSYANSWYHMKAIWVNGFRSLSFYNLDYSKQYEYTSPKPWAFPGINAQNITGQWFGGVKTFGSNGNINYDNISISKGIDIKLYGLVSGMKYSFISSDDVSQSFSGVVENVSPTVNTIDKIIPLNGKWHIYGLDGSNMYNSPSNVVLYGGDTWSYSGDTATIPTPTPTKVPAGGKVINEMGGM